MLKPLPGKVILTALILMGFALNISAQQRDTLAHSFLPSDDALMSAFGLKWVKSDQHQSLWATKTADNNVSEVKDIRYAFSSKAEAGSYLEGNLEHLSDSGLLILDKEEMYAVRPVYVFRESIQQAKRYEARGLMTVRWCFLFVIDKILVKEVITGSNTPYYHAYDIAMRAHNRAMEATGASVIERWDRPVFNAPNDFLRKLLHAKLRFENPAGFDFRLPDTFTAVRSDLVTVMMNGACELRLLVMPYDSEYLARGIYPIKGLNADSKEAHSIPDAAKLFQQIVASISGDSAVALKSIKPIPLQTLHSRYGAEKGYMAIVKPGPGYPKTYTICRLMLLVNKQKGAACLMQFALNEYWLEQMPQTVKYALKFRDK